jgi:acyl-CoA thioester hydrolase
VTALSNYRSRGSRRWRNALSARILCSGRVGLQRIDALGHMNFLEYQRIADEASDLFWTEIGGQPASLDLPLSYVMLKTDVHYLRELRVNDAFVVETSNVAHDARRFHLYHVIVGPKGPACVVQVLFLAFDPRVRRAAIWTDPMLQALSEWKGESPGPQPAEVLHWVPRALV